MRAAGRSRLPDFPNLISQDTDLSERIHGTVLLDGAGRRRSPARMPGYDRGRPPRVRVACAIDGGGTMTDWGEKSGVPFPGGILCDSGSAGV
jgi:hypothetical protein